MIGRLRAYDLRLRRAALRHHATLSRVLPRGYHAYRFSGGRILLDVRESPMMLARAIGMYEPAKAAALRRLLRPGMTFVDVGVNKGDFSLQAARLMGDTGTVHAFEPEPENCSWIRRSIALNGYSCITVHELALGDLEGRAELYLGATSGTHTLVRGVPRRRGGTVEVRTRRLDDVLAEAGCARVDVMKIDVEGSEESVLRGAETTLAGSSPMAVLIDLHPPIIRSAVVCEWLERRGFSIRQPHDLDSPLRDVDDSVREVAALRGGW